MNHILFRDRTEAGQCLAEQLSPYRREHPLVLGLPRGGVVVAAAVARALESELDVLVIKKITPPYNPELAIGALAEDGAMYLSQDIVRVLDLAEGYIEDQRRRILAEIQSRVALYRTVRPAVPVQDRCVIVVDDGIATGATIITACQVLTTRHPHQLVVAVPVGPPETIARLTAMAEIDQVVCPYQPEGFGGVGQFYDNFEQIPDQEVMGCLKGETNRKNSASGA